MKKSTLLHLRIPFSFFLLPVFLLALAVSPNVDTTHAILVFIILHVLVYPASNGYNSYFDKDEGSIGGLRHPPKVTSELYYTSLVLDAVALLLATFISLEFAIMVLIYGLVSKGYSHPSIRLKKYPIIGWLVAGVFQGYFTYLLCYIAINDIPIIETFTLKIQLPGILSSMILLGSYPMTQIYQHDEDRNRGDITLSQKLGILGTFHFTSLMFLMASTGFMLFFSYYYTHTLMLVFLIAMLPILVYFGWWYWQVRKEPLKANYEHTMRLNFISSLMLNGIFFYIWLS